VAREWLLPLLTAIVLTTILAIVITAPRFDMTAPSTIDDWSMIRHGEQAFHQLLSLNYDPATYDGGRYRPAFYGVWSPLQWHSFGAPYYLRSANAWNLVRIVVFLLALAALVLALVRPERRREIAADRFGPIWLGVLAALPGTLVLLTPAFAVDLARFGPQEPLMLGGIVLGALAVLWALRGDRPAGSRAGAMAGGLVLWYFGVYIKEAALGVLVAAPFVVVGLRQARGPGGASRPWWIAGAVLFALPVVHLAREVLKINSEGQLLYGGAEPLDGPFAMPGRVVDILDQQWSGVPAALAGSGWQLGWLLAIASVAALGIVRRRVPWYLVAVVALALALLVYQGFLGVVVSRYLLPVCALAAVAIAAVALEWSTLTRVQATIGVALLAFVLVGDARWGVRTWITAEQQRVAFMRAVDELNPRSCPVYAATWDLERKYSVPELVALGGYEPRECQPGMDAVLVWGDSAPITLEEQAIKEQGCATGWQPIPLNGARVEGCRRLRKGPVRLSDGRRLDVTALLDSARIQVPDDPILD
jgi:hypothetical protein